MLFEMVISGSGGQGILFIGNLLAQAALHEGRHVTFLPVYGVAMRGGTANCVVTISDDEIGSPVLHRPHAAILMNQASLDKYQAVVQPGGLIIANASTIDISTFRRTGELRFVAIPATDIAREAVQSERAANMVALGAFLGLEPVVQPASVEAIVSHGGSAMSPDAIRRNLAALRVGYPGGHAPITTARPAAPPASVFELPETVVTESSTATQEAPKEIETLVFEGDGYVAPWINSDKCSTCEECVNVNPNIFGYDHHKKAYIKDPHGGPYKDLVHAAERCTEKIIHPGFPADRTEPGVARLIEKAKKYM